MSPRLVLRVLRTQASDVNQKSARRSRVSYLTIRPTGHTERKSHRLARGPFMRAPWRRAHRRKGGRGCGREGGRRRGEERAAKGLRL
eukprot:1945281-Prymnesium_polylepis.1